MATKSKTPLRQCTGCREMKNKKELMRVIRTPDGEICLDCTGRANGRGAYLCKSSECFTRARKSKGLERSLKVSIPEEIYEKLEKELEGIG